MNKACWSASFEVSLQLASSRKPTHIATIQNAHTPTQMAIRTAGETNSGQMNVAVRLKFRATANRIANIKARKSPCRHSRGKPGHRQAISERARISKTPASNAPNVRHPSPNVKRILLLPLYSIKASPATVQVRQFAENDPPSPASLADSVPIWQTNQHG